ncbi:hypothetical protein SDC9_145153 [bioreactor metagenome]|uniref:Uncharacterized protein n=1 Tax=bioreactor metagenome TaxID=1076179 RepID=A0A645EBD6_9ZZZZ
MDDQMKVIVSADNKAATIVVGLQGPAGPGNNDDSLPVLEYTYNPDGTIATIEDNGQFTYTLTYNADKTIDTISNGNRTIKCQYDSNGRFAGTVLL